MGNFSDAKRERVARQLREAGRELFARHGLQKTTVSDLTESAGIATGTFYQFYDSKEDLYIDLLEEESHKAYTHAISESFETYEDPQKAIETFLQLMMDVIENNPLIYRLIADDELGRLYQYRPDDERETDREVAVAYLLPYLQEWYDEDELVGPSTEAIAHSIRAVRLLALHEEEIGSEHYDEVRDTIISAIARGFTQRPTETT